MTAIYSGFEVQKQAFDHHIWYKTYLHHKSNILLIGMPMIFALNYKPEAKNTEELFFEVAGKLSGNLGGLLFALVGIGAIVSFFALVAPKPEKKEQK